MARLYREIDSPLSAKFLIYLRQWLILVVLSISGAAILWSLPLVVAVSVVFFDVRNFNVVVDGLSTFLESLSAFIFLDFIGFFLFAIVSISQVSSLVRIRGVIAFLVIGGGIAKFVIDVISHQPWLKCSNQHLAFLIWVFSCLVTARVLRRLRR